VGTIVKDVAFEETAKTRNGDFEHFRSLGFGVKLLLDVVHGVAHRFPASFWLTAVGRQTPSGEASL
jgi:hypothetical protein